MHASAFQHRAAGTAGDHTGTRAGRAQHHHTRCRLALHRVGDRAADQRDAEEVLARFLHTLGDRGRHLFGLAVSDADHAVAVADDHQRGEAEPATTLDHLRNAVDRDDALDVVGLLSAVAATAIRRPRPSRRSRPSRESASRGARGCSVRLSADATARRQAMSPARPSCNPSVVSHQNSQPALPRCVGQRRDPSAVGVATPVEHHGVDAGGLRPLGDQLADPHAVGLLVSVDGAHVRLRWTTRPPGWCR